MATGSQVSALPTAGSRDRKAINTAHNTAAWTPKNQKISIAEAYQTFLSVLETNGLTIIPHGKFLKIVESAGVATQTTQMTSSAGCALMMLASRLDAAVLAAAANDAGSGQWLSSLALRIHAAA